MADFVENFTGAANGTLLQDWNSWVKIGTGTNMSISSERVSAAGNAALSMYRAPTAPDSNSQTLEFTGFSTSSPTSSCVSGRMSSDAQNMYFWRFAAGLHELWKRVAGTTTRIATYTGDVPDPARAHILTLTDAAKTVTVSGVERITSTDNDVTAIGHWGVGSFFSNAANPPYLDTLHFYNLSSGLTIAPTSIASNESFGAPALNYGLSPTTIVSAESLGTPTISYLLSPTTIVTGESVGVPQLMLALSPASIASQESFGQALLNYLIAPAGIASAESFGTPSLNGSLLISPSSIASQEAIGTPTITYHLAPSSVGSQESVGTPQIVYTVAPTSIASLELFGLAQLGYSVAPASVATAEAFGVPNLVISAGGAVVLLPSSIDSLEVFGVPTVGILHRGSQITSARVAPSKTAARIQPYKTNARVLSYA